MVSIVLHSFILVDDKWTLSLRELSLFFSSNFLFHSQPPESKLDGRFSLYRGEIITLIIWTNGLMIGYSEPAGRHSVRGNKDLQMGGWSSGAGRALQESSHVSHLDVVLWKYEPF